MDAEKRQQAKNRLQRQIRDLERQLADLSARFPAHSLPPALMATMDELDEQLADARAQLAALVQSHSD